MQCNPIYSLVSACNNNQQLYGLTETLAFDSAWLLTPPLTRMQWWQVPGSCPRLIVENRVYLCRCTICDILLIRLRALRLIFLFGRSPTHQIQIYNQYGQFVRKFGANILQHPRGVCVDNKGRIIVVECKVFIDILFNVLAKMFLRNC